MRSRYLKPSFFTNEKLIALPMADRLLFQGLWCLADREGRLEDRPMRIKYHIFPGDDVDVDASLNRLAEAGFVQRYEREGARFLCITGWTEHQKPHPNETQSKLPEPLQP